MKTSWLLLATLLPLTGCNNDSDIQKTAQDARLKEITHKLDRIERQKLSTVTPATDKTNKVGRFRILNTTLLSYGPSVPGSEKVAIRTDPKVVKLDTTTGETWFLYNRRAGTNSLLGWVAIDTLVPVEPDIDEIDFTPLPSVCPGSNTP